MPTKYSPNRFVGKPPGRLFCSSGGFSYRYRTSSLQKNTHRHSNRLNISMDADGDKVKNTEINSYI